MYQVDVLVYKGMPNADVEPIESMFTVGRLYYLRSTKKGTRKLLTTDMENEVLIHYYKAQGSLIHREAYQLFMQQFALVDKMEFTNYKDYRKNFYAGDNRLLNYLIGDRQFARNGQGVSVLK